MALTDEVMMNESQLSMESPRMRRGLAHIALGVVVGLLISGRTAALDEVTSHRAVASESVELVVASASDPLAVTWLPGTVARWSPEIHEAAARHGVDPDLLAIVVLVESGGYADAVSPAGAVGLMQVMPATGRDIAARRGIASFHDEDLADPATNLDFGAWYLADQLRAFGRADDEDWAQSVALAAAAYNGGPGHVQSHLRGTTLATETAQYQGWVSGMWRERHAATSTTYDQWVHAGGWRLLTMAAASPAL